MAVTYTKTAWSDRIVQRPRTYTHAVNEDQSVTHTPAPGLVVHEGTPRSAENMNHIEDGIGACVDAINALEGAAVTEVVFTVTVPATGWTGLAAPYTKSVTVSGVKSSDDPFIDIAASGNYTKDQAMCDDWGLVYRVTTSNNSIKLFAHEVPSAAMTLRVRCLRHG